MKIVYIILLSVCGFTHYVHGQEIDKENQKRINQIKKTGDYIYAEATMQDWYEAFEAAKAILETQIGDWVKSLNKQSDVSGYIAKAGDHLLEIKTKRGSYYRAFLYVKKVDLIPYTSNDNLMVIPLCAENQEKDIVEVTLHDSNIKNNEKESNHIQSETETHLAENDPIIKEMEQVQHFDDIKAFIQRYESNNQIKRYGKYATLPQKGKIYLFIYSRSGTIQDHLLKIDDIIYKLPLRELTDISDYKNCGAIWFELK